MKNHLGNLRWRYAYGVLIWGANPWADWAQIFFGGRGPRRNHAIQIWWRSVQGFLVGWASKFALSQILKVVLTTLTLSCEVWFRASVYKTTAHTTNHYYYCNCQYTYNNNLDVQLILEMRLILGTQLLFEIRLLSKHQSQIPGLY